MLDRLLTWKVAVCLGAGALAALILAVVFWPQVYAYCDRMGNFFTVLGFVLGLLAFVITIATLLDIRRTEKEAARRIEAAAAQAEEAVSRARADARAALEKMALLLLSAEAGNLLRIVNDLRAAIRNEQWERAVVFCREASLATIPLIGNPQLTEDERQWVRGGGLDMAALLRYIETKWLGAAEPPEGFHPPKIKALDNLLDSLGNIQVRLRREAMEATHACQ
jgi:hypothetical protein